MNIYLAWLVLISFFTLLCYCAGDKTIPDGEYWTKINPLVKRLFQGLCRICYGIFLVISAISAIWLVLAAAITVIIN